MTILIKGMEMPKEIDETLSIQIANGIDGKCYARYCLALGSVGEWHEMEELPPHGRLIDADELLTDANKLRYGEGWLITVENIEAAPAVIEAEEKE